jgi:hypothetical protein
LLDQSKRFFELIYGQKYPTLLIYLVILNMSDDEDFMQDSDQEGYVIVYLSRTIANNLGTTSNMRKMMMRKVVTLISKTNTTMQSR